MSKVEKLPMRLKTARIAAGFRTATEFCDKFQIPISTYNMHETGRRKLMPKIAEQYSKYLDVNPAWLITGIGSPYLSQSELVNNSPLSEEEYLNLLSYDGNKKINSIPGTPIQSLHVEPTLFSKIIFDMINTIKQFHIELDLKFVTQHAIEIYIDIVNTSDAQSEQLAMVPLAITIFKRQLKKSTDSQG